MVRKLVKKLSACVLAAAVVAGLTGCGSVTSGKRIVRISHAQSETHPSIWDFWHLRSMLRNA